VELLGRVASGVIWAIAQFAVASVKDTVALIAPPMTIKQLEDNLLPKILPTHEKQLVEQS